jgi:hypothetical protein
VLKLQDAEKIMFLKSNEKATKAFASFRFRCIAVASLLFSLVFCGCEREQKVQQSDSPSRVQDPVYKARLKELVGENKKIAVRRNHILATMEKVKSIARKALPEGATQEQVIAEIENNPDKYPVWQRLGEQLQAVEKEFKVATIKARAEIAERIKRDMPNDNKTRSKGTAK